MKKEQNSTPKFDLKAIENIDFNNPQFLKDLEEINRKCQELIDSADRHDPLDLLEKYY